MQPDKFRNLPVKADAARNIDLVTEYIDPGYTAEVCLEKSTTSSGWLVLFRITPNNVSLPGFVGRWEDSTQAVDVDPDPVHSIHRDHWKGETNGYRGHHTERVSVDPRVYQIDLQTPAGPVFKGKLRLNIDIGVCMKDAFTLTAEVAMSVDVVRPS
jgi:hypothetical protein